MVKKDLLLSCAEKRLSPVSDPHSALAGELGQMAGALRILESNSNQERNISTAGSASDCSLLLNNARLQRYGAPPERNDK